MIQIEREKLEKVLDALEYHDSLHGDTTQQAITIIKDVLAQPDQFRDATKMMTQPEQEPVAKNEEGRITWLVDNWPQNCFLYSEPPTWTPVEIGVDVTPEGAHVVGMYVLPDVVRYVFYSKFHSAPQRTWVGLTEDDKVLIKHDANFNQFMTAGEYADRVQALTEARLKDKNTSSSLEEHNFCPRCGKRNKDIHTCTPPQD